MFFLIIWDEYKYGKQVYDKGVLTKRWQYKELKCLVKYMLADKRKLREVREKLSSCCKENLKYLKDEYKQQVFNKLINQAKHEEIIHAKEVVIYKSELRIIEGLDDEVLERMLFVLLVYCKWLDNMECFALMRADIFREAKISNPNSNTVRQKLFQLCQTGHLRSELITTRNKRSGSGGRKKQMWSLPFLKTEGDVAFTITNYDNVVNKYRNYKEGGYFECTECGGMFKKTNNRHTVCAQCKKDIEREQARKRMAKMRKNNKQQRKKKVV